MSKGITQFEELMRLVMNNMFTSLPGKVISYEKRYAKMQIMVGTQAAKDVPLVNVPILRMLGGSVPVKKGMIFPVWFTKNALGEFLMSFFSSQTSKGPIEEMQFDRNSAYALPFLFDEKLGVTFPETVEFDIKVIFKEPIECEKTALFKADVTNETNVTTKGDSITSGKIEAGGTLSSKGELSAPNFDKHHHVDDEGRDTGGPIHDRNKKL